MSHRSLVLGALGAVLCCSASLEAQFTTFVPPRRDTVTRDTLAVDSARTVTSADTAMRQSMTNMKAWVDSAANVGTPVSSRAQAQAGGTVEFRDGAPAPNTATPLPLLLLVGVGAIGVGIALIRGGGGGTA